MKKYISLDIKCKNFEKIYNYSIKYRKTYGTK